MKYERLTIRETFGMPFCAHQVDNDCLRLNCNGCPAIINRLAELEDKIENSTLIFKEEIPCKVGDEVYHISVEGVRPGRIIRITVPNIPICIDTSCGDLFIGEIGGTLFFTKD